MGKPVLYICKLFIKSSIGHCLISILHPVELIKIRCLDWVLVFYFHTNNSKKCKNNQFTILVYNKFIVLLFYNMLYCSVFRIISLLINFLSQANIISTLVYNATLFNHISHTTLTIQLNLKLFKSHYVCTNKYITQPNTNFWV